MSEDIIVQARNLPPQAFKWHTWDKTNHNSSKITSCRNSVQGKVLIADDKGKSLSKIIFILYMGLPFHCSLSP